MINIIKKKEFYATCPSNCEDLLLKEVEASGAVEIKQTVRAIHFKGSIRDAYWLCLNSRIANRVILLLAREEIVTGDDLYDVAKKINWGEHFSSRNSFTINCSLASFNMTKIINSNYGAQVVKDAICDYFREEEGYRPNLDNHYPDITINVQILKNEVLIGLDLSGESLSKRGYRKNGAIAPLKENSAAAMLLRADWDKEALTRKTFIDLMCGSGTILIEALSIATNSAPGLLRAKYKEFGFFAWKQHEANSWEGIVEEARKNIVKTDVKFIGFELNKMTYAICKSNIEFAKYDKMIDVRNRNCFLIEKKDLGSNFDPAKCFIATNPPYGVRLGDLDEINLLYNKLGDYLKDNFPGSKVAILAGSKDSAKSISIKADKINSFYNGKLEIALAVFNIFDTATREKLKDDYSAKIKSIHEGNISDGAKMFVNRLAKNQKELNKFLEQNNITCYRIYDADMPEYSAAIDVYKNIDDELFVHISEYEPPKTVLQESREKHLMEMIDGVINFFKIDDKSLFFKTRLRQKGKNQYEKFDSKNRNDVIVESNLKFTINLSDYLDTLIFLDHRYVRNLIRTKANGKRFLNLFCYTATATVYAIDGNAKKTVSVDKSNRYLDIAKMNFDLNKMNGDNLLVREDCLTYLKNCREEFDLIFLDPPTFSNSKSLRDDFDIQVAHKELIDNCLKLLSNDGELIFSTNYKKFQLDDEIISSYNFKEISKETIDKDFSRDESIHKCWIFYKK